MKKQCRTCGTDFTPTPNQVKKSDWWCPACRRAYMRAWGKKRRAQGLPSGGTMPSEWWKDYWRKYGKRPKVRARKAAQMRRYTKDPKLRARHMARWMLSRAITSGRIEKLPCALCGAKQVQAHHPDYSKPLLIVWLCSACHRKEHAKAKGTTP